MLIVLSTMLRHSNLHPNCELLDATHPNIRLVIQICLQMCGVTDETIETHASHAALLLRSIRS